MSSLDRCVDARVKLMTQSQCSEEWGSKCIRGVERRGIQEQREWKRDVLRTRGGNAGADVTKGQIRAYRMALQQQ